MPIIESPQPFSAGLMSSESSFGISFGGALVMTGFRFFAVLAGVTRRITIIPAVMPISGVGRLCTGVFV